MREGGIDLVLVDYLQLVGPDAKGRSRNDELGEVSAGMKAMSLELNAAVVVLSQLSRECKKERRLPRLSDLRESGSIEQDADVVMFLSWPTWLSEFQENGRPNTRMRKLDVQKQRNGPTREFDISWEGKYQRFADLEVDRDDDRYWWQEHDED
jgi:replicative DNA helicase